MKKPSAISRTASKFADPRNLSKAVEAQKARQRSQAEYLAPVNPAEETLAAIWSKLLAIDKVGRNDNFFQMGGHSLMAVQVIARVRQTFEVEMPLRAMFDSPTLAAFTERMEAERRASQGVVIPPLTKVRLGNAAPLSFAQQRLWFIDQLEPGNALYNIAQMYRMRGTLNVEALERALNEIVRRHETLRSAYRNVDGQAIQVIAPTMRLPLRLVTISGATDAEREADVHRIARGEARQPFELAKAPLIRATLLRVKPDDHVLLVTLHHIVGDGWSGNLIATEIAALYEAFSRDLPSPLPELSIQYADFAVWQRGWLQGKLKDSRVAYWRQQLSGAPPFLDLPTDRPRPAVQQHNGDIYLRVLPLELIDRLRTLAQSDGATLFMALLAAFQLMLSRYSGQEDVVVGSSVAGRNQAEIEPLIGFFVNTLPMRTDLSGNPSFRQLLERAKQVALDAYAHQEVPFERLVEELQPERSLSYNPVFQVLFGLQNVPKQSFAVSSLHVERVPRHQGTSILDMSWFAFETPDGLQIRVEYDTDLFDASTIARAIDHYETLLKDIVANPERHISEYNLLSDEERHRVLVEFNATSQEFPTGEALHQFFEHQAHKTPDATAIVCGQERTTYRDLNAKANQVAHYLSKRGAGPDVLIGIYFERSINMLVGMLGVLKAGAAYVPLDPNYPKERIGYILEDAHAPIVLTQRSLLDELSGIDAERICLDANWPIIAEESTKNLEKNPGSTNLAYVLFTSGSTGRPKGVAIEHRSVATLLHWAQNVFSPQELAGVLLSTSICFDLSIFEIFVTWSAGGKLIVAENALYLPTLPAKNEVTLINTVPSAMAELVRMDGVPVSIKTVNLAGEALPEALVEQIYANTTVSKVYNLYGPTEDTTYSTYTLVRSDLPVTIGRPIANSQAYVLDSNLKPVPIGVPGELYLAGEGLARGYYGRADLTSERFVTNPFKDVAGARMYRTGDVCRWLADGNLQYLGRADHQVKVRGFRIELGEVETVLDNHPGVQQSIVMAREDEPGDKRLVAYVVPDPAFIASRPTDNGDDKSSALLTELPHWLKDKLPAFMIPTAFVLMEAMPLSPNGKVNRQALPAPERSREESTVYVAPRTPLEENLATIWSEVLHIDKIGVQDNFFSLGGHSLLATQVISRIRQSAGIDLPLRYIFEWPTISELVLKIEEVQSAGAIGLPPVERVARGEALPLSFAQQRLWFLDQLEPNNPLYNVPLAIRLNGTLRGDILSRSFNEIVRRHEVLRTTYVVHGDQPAQVIAEQLEIDVPVIDLTGLASEAQDAEVRRMGIENGRQVFDLTKGPLLRASLLKLDEQEHVLLLNTHHIVTDGWSIWRFVRELAVLYDAYLADEPSPLPELPVQYADFAAWQRKWIDGDVLESQLSYWTKRLAGAPGSIELPTDHPRPAVLSYRGAVEKVIYPRSLVDKLNALSRREGVTLFMTLLAAYQTLLFRYTGQEDLAVGSPLANRTQVEIEDLIGFFVNTVVMRTDVSGNPTFRELLRRVRATALGAYSNQDLPFERLVEAIQPERDLGRTPLFQVWFVLQNAPPTAFRLPGIEVKGIDLHNGTSKFDIGMFLTEKPEGLVCSLEYSTELFEPATIRRLISHYEVLLHAIADSPELPISELPLLTKAERQQVVVDWNKTEHDYPDERCLHEFIEEQVGRTPDAPALVFESEQLTYRELNARANQLAHRLHKTGVGPETLVAVCAERSVEMVVALLGTMKAGGAYVPLDPGYPRTRLALMLEDAEPPVLLTQEHLLEALPEHGIPTICLDRDWHTLADEPMSNPAVLTKGSDQAYAIYTSGSTGKPKGVPNVHRGIVNRLLWMQAAYGLNGSDRVLQKTPYSFDVSVWEFFWPLMTGACLVVARPEGHKDPDYLLKLILDEQITTMHFVPSMLRVFLETEGVERCTSLRRVICSGEALPLELTQRFFERLGKRCSAELHNLYGPTEAAVDVSYWQCTKDSPLGLVPIGKPIWNTQLYILDKSLQPVPIGIPGELHIGGVNLARGYLKQPDLTAQKFIRDPFSDKPGARLYKTGDLARFLPDGNIEYLGRIDHQVKLRGFRIELGEIETTIDAHPGVRQSVVVAREDIPGDKRVVAYAVPDPDYRGAEASESEQEEALTTEQVSQWSEAFDEAYRRGDDAAEATFNIKGWDSSYTGQPIPTEEMRVWVETTVERIRDLRPKRVWEIGCGTGLLLFRVAPGCEQYYGTDISQTALSFLEQQLRRPELHLPQVTLERKAAHEFDRAPTQGQFDAVVLNSVVQYFPDLEYCISVLEGAVESVRAGGAVVVGDVRCFPLLETFHASVQLFRAPDAMSPSDLRQRVQKSIRQEGELLIDPEFFSALRHRLPQISRVEIQLKRGHAHNELTRFRYDVVLHVGETAAPKVDCAWIDWKKQGLTPAMLHEILEKTQPEMIGLTNVPNARLWQDAVALRAIASEEAPANIGELRHSLQPTPADAVEPEDIWTLEQSLPYRAEIRMSKTAVDGCCDIVLRRTNNDETIRELAVPRFPGEDDTIRSWSAYANNPLRQRVVGKLAPQLRTWVAARLPEYMVPSLFILLDAMPLTSSGKVNRRALPAPDQGRAENEIEYTAPQTPAEELVSAIFADVLHIERVGIQDDFFELGGHSLSATQVVARVRQSFHVDVPVRALFESPTVASLSRVIERMVRGEQGLVPPPIVAVPRDQRLPLSFAQQRLWVLDQIEPNNPLYNIPRPMRLAGPLNVPALEDALNGIVARHEVLRTTYGSEKGQPFQVIAPELKVPLQVIDLSVLPAADREAEARRIVDQEVATPFDLAHDSITRNVLLRMATDDHILMMTTHHIASDGWSTGILMREICALYETALNGHASPPPELPIQYADYAIWQRNWLQGEVLDKQVAYWKKQLDGAPPVLQLPADRERPTKPGLRGTIHHFLLPQSLTGSVRSLSRQCGATSFMTMLAAFQTLVLHLTKQTDVVLGTDLANRTTVETENLLGFFVNLLAMRTDLSGDPSFEELVARVRDVAFGAYAHQDLPFDKLVEELQPERSLSHNPIVQVLFVQQNTPRSATPMPGIEIAPYPLEVPSKFDMAAFMAETDQGVAGRWLYNPDLFEAATVARMAELYQLVLEKVTVNPALKLSELSGMLTEAILQHRSSQHQAFEDVSQKKLKNIKRRAMTGD